MNVPVAVDAKRRPISNMEDLTSALEQAPFEIEVVGRGIGAEIHGLDLREPLAPETFASLEAAVIKYKVAYIRDQHISSARHVEIGRMFGELEVHPFRPQGELPELLVLDNHKDNPVLSTDVWHSDTTFRLRPTKYSILRCLRTPPSGGDTLWADMTAAYRGLSAPLQEFLCDMRAVHDFKNFRVLYRDKKDDLRKMEELYPNPSHPVVRTHPVTGEKALYVNSQFTLRIEGLRDEESQALLQLLVQQPRVPEYQFRLHWKPGTITFWDNTSTQHYAANDYYPERRTMERVAVEGDEPF